MTQKIIRTGNSAAVVVPADFIRNIGVKIGDEVKVETRPEKAVVIYTFKGTHQLPLSENFLLKRKRRKKHKDSL